LGPREVALEDIPASRGRPFYGYIAKKGYINARNPTRIPHMIAFIQGRGLRNTSTQQAIAKIWHNSRPKKVGTLIWLTFNQGLPVRSWLQIMGIPPH